MDVCPITFYTGPPSLPRFLPSASIWAYADPLLTITLTFPENMDLGDEPPATDFVLTVDDVVKTVLDKQYTDATHFELTYSEGTLGPSVVEVRYSRKSALFQSALEELVTPFDMIITAP